MNAAPRPGDALAHLDEAIDALTLESWTQRIDSFDRSWSRTPALEATIAEELFRFDAAIGGHRKSAFAILGEEIKRAVIEIEAARQALRGDAPTVEIS